MSRTASALMSMALALVASLAPCRAAGAQAQPPRAAADVQRDLLAIEKAIYRANNECDYEYFAHIEAEEFIFTGADGSVTTRAQDLASEKDCRKGDNVFVIDEPRLLRYDSVAVLNARLVTQSAAGQVLRRSRFTDVFVWRDRRWQLVLGHSTRLAP